MQSIGGQSLYNGDNQGTSKIMATITAKLATTLLVEPFIKWGLDLIGLIKHVRRSIHGTHIFW
jgi:hypothetical protein